MPLRGTPSSKTGMSTALPKGIKSIGLEAVCFKDACRDRTQYLQRPDKGRCLDVASRQYLKNLNQARNRCGAGL